MMNVHADSVEAWVRGELALSCVARDALASEEGAAQQAIIHQAVTLAYRHGYHLPLAMAIDLAWLYLNPESALLTPSKAWKGLRSPLSAESYCTCLNGAASAGSLRNLFVQARRARRMTRRWIALGPLPADGADPARQAAPPARPEAQREIQQEVQQQETAAVAALIEQVAAWVYRQPGQSLPRLPEGVARRIASGRWSLAEAEAVRSPLHRDLAPRLAAFLKVFAGDGENHPALASLFDSDTEAQLALAAARRRAGAERIDYRLLEACLGYQPMTFTPAMRARLQRVRQTLSPKKIARSRSPECGVHGLARNGPLHAVLPSELVHDDWAQRILVGESLFYDLYAPREERQRVLLAWVIDRSASMSVRVDSGTSEGRPVRLRRDVHARRLAAAMIEDAARNLIDSPALDLWVAVLFFGLDERDGQRSYRDQLIVPTQQSLRRAPAGALASRAGTIWLPKEECFLPEFFLRDPAWDRPASTPRTPSKAEKGNRNDDATESPPRPADSGPALRHAFQRLALHIRAMSKEDTGRTEGSSLDACHVVVMTGDEAILEQAANGTVSPLAAVSGFFTINSVFYGPSEITWRQGRGTRQVSPQAVESYLDFPADHEVRVAAWKSLLSTLGYL